MGRSSQGNVRREGPQPREQEVSALLESVEAIEAQIQARLHYDRRKVPGFDYDGQPISRWYLERIPCLLSADGLKMSVQTSYSHYCSPRDSYGPWFTVEVGFPNRRVEALMPYIDGGADTDPTDAVYGYVPLRTVAEVIAAAGGLLPEERSNA